MSLGGMARESVARANSATTLAVADDDQLKKARDGLAHYVPTEVVAFFVAALGIAHMVRESVPDEGYRALLATLLALGAVFSFVGIVAIYRNALDPPPPWRRSPWRKASISCLAFVAWAFAMPGFLPAAWQQALAAIGALALTMVFHWFDRWIETMPA
jgi:drug/metabolite transporter (DMT)-like permease